MSIILVVDDSPDNLTLMSGLLSDDYTVKVANDGEKALRIIAGSTPPDLILLDLMMPKISGEEVLAQVSKKRPDIPVIVITAIDDTETAVRCIKAGACDYLIKPIDHSRLLTIVRKALEFDEMRQENVRLSEAVIEGALKNPEIFAGIITNDSKMNSLFRYIESVAITSQPVLISGETGVGKELFAQAVHDCSGRTGPIISVNIAGLDDAAFTDTLFGHKRGAFTGADRDRPGLIERAEKGTLFLDEIGDLDSHSQVKLLRLLQEHEYYPLGSDQPRRSTARIVAATNLDLETASKSGSFRADLYYRLYLHHISIPPLRERRNDIPILTRVFLRKAAEELKMDTPVIGAELEKLILRYPFPGNIRELSSLLYDALSRQSSDSEPFASMQETISKSYISELSSVTKVYPKTGNIFSGLDTLPTLEEAGELLIDEAMKRTDNNKTLAADMLSVTRQTLLRRFKKRTADINE